MYMSNNSPQHNLQHKKITTLKSIGHKSKNILPITKHIG